MTCKTNPGRTTPRRPRRGFTLIELLVAVGAVAVLAVAVAAVFETTGSTVRTGRRLSAFNTLLAMIEQQLKRDIAAMTRDGHLVIRNEYADANGDGGFAAASDLVLLSESDRTPRPRRIDELMFFAKGSFISAREPLAAGVPAEASAARIYYGHGKRRRPLGAAGLYTLPQLDDPNNEAGCGLGLDSSGNPNRFASDWILLRHVTCLAPPQATLRVLPPSVAAMGIAPAEAYDMDTQIGMAPAASSAFRVLATLFPNFSKEPGGAVRGTVRPAFSSGMVGVATDDLASIRAIVTTCSKYPGQLAAITDFDKEPSGRFQLETKPSGSPTPVLTRMQQWMDETLPAWSHAAAYADRTRIRCEPAPPDLLKSMDPAVYGTAVERAFRRADQQMLAASDFLPRCTEFIVEWSFGQVYPSTDPRQGETIWYGLRRNVGGVLMADYYNDKDPFVQFYRRFTRVDGAADPYLTRTDLIHGQAVATGGPAADSLTSYFGYADPTFNPDRTGDGKLTSAADSAATTLDWPWPTLIRVTVSLADPNDATVEQTFQFVFDVPQGR